MRKFALTAAFVAIAALTGCTNAEVQSDNSGNVTSRYTGRSIEDVIEDAIGIESVEPVDNSQHTAATEEELVWGLLNAFVSRDQTEFDRYPSNFLSTYSRIYKEWCQVLDSHDMDYHAEYTCDDFPSYVSVSPFSDGRPDSIHIYFPSTEPFVELIVTFDFDYETDLYSIDTVKCYTGYTKDSVQRSMAAEEQDPIDFSIFTGGGDDDGG